MLSVSVIVIVVAAAIGREMIFAWRCITELTERPDPVASACLLE